MAGRGESWALKRILCATDFSDNAAAALDAAVALARPANAKILVVHVTPLPVRSRGVGTCSPAPLGVDQKGRADLIENLERFGRPALAAGVETEPVLRQGDPAEEIVREAQHAGADLIVMGRHSRGTPNDWFLGSIVERVLRNTPCPVMVVKPFPRRRGQRPRHVICALDLGETSAATMAHAAALTGALQANLLVLHVVAGPAHDVQDARAGLAALVAGASVPSGRVQQQVVAGMPHEEILGAGREGGIDLVVVGSHGGGILDRQFIGSTTLHLLRQSECDVLVVPAQVSPGEEQSKTRSPELAGVPAPRSLGRA